MSKWKASFFCITDGSGRFLRNLHSCLQIYTIPYRSTREQ